MAAPEYVPVPPLVEVRTYESPPRRPDPWLSVRPGDFEGGQPEGDGYGIQGPDQGYALKLANVVFRPLLKLGRLSAEDVIAGCLGIALKRAALYGRAPVAEDWRVAFTFWGFLDDSPDPALVAEREEWFAGVAHPHHYAEARRVVDSVPDEILKPNVRAVPG